MFHGSKSTWVKIRQTVHCFSSKVWVIMLFGHLVNHIQMITVIFCLITFLLPLICCEIWSQGTHGLWHCTRQQKRLPPWFEREKLVCSEIHTQQCGNLVAAMWRDKRVVSFIHKHSSRSQNPCRLCVEKESELSPLIQWRNLTWWLFITMTWMAWTTNITVIILQAQFLESGGNTCFGFFSICLL